MLRIPQISLEKIIELFSETDFKIGATSPLPHLKLKVQKRSSKQMRFGTQTMCKAIGNSV